MIRPMKRTPMCSLAVFAAQHHMLWVSLGLPPGWNSSTGSDQDLNRLGFWLGAAAATDVRKRCSVPSANSNPPPTSPKRAESGKPREERPSVHTCSDRVRARSDYGGRLRSRQPAVDRTTESATRAPPGTSSMMRVESVHRVGAIIASHYTLEARDALPGEVQQEVPEGGPIKADEIGSIDEALELCRGRILVSGHIELVAERDTVCGQAAAYGRGSLGAGLLAVVRIGPGVQRLGTLTTIAINRHGLQPQPPRIQMILKILAYPW